MNKTDVINKLADRLDGDKKTAQAAVEGFIDIVQRAVHGDDKVAISGFGVFEKRARAARTARNPRTGEAVKVKKTTVPIFRPGSFFSDVISGKVKMPKATGGVTTARAAAAAAKAAPTRGRAAAAKPAAAAAAPAKTTRTRAAAKPAAAAPAAAAPAKTTRTRAAAKPAAAPAAAPAKTTRTRAAAKPAAAQRRRLRSRPPGPGPPLRRSPRPPAPPRPPRKPAAAKAAPKKAPAKKK